MARTTLMADLLLDGYQAIMKPSKFGYSLAGLLDADTWKEVLDKDREDSLSWCKSHLKNPNKSCLNPEPYEVVGIDRLKVKFSWNDETKPYIMDTECVPITDLDLPLYSGCKVSIAFYQKPFILRDSFTYGTTLKLIGIQVLEVHHMETAGGYTAFEDVAKLFGKRDGFKLSAY
jgi:hypothetical protein